MMVSPHREKPSVPKMEALQGQRTAHSCKDYRKWATKAFPPSPDMDGHAGFTFQVNPPISPYPTHSGSCRYLPRSLPGSTGTVI